MATLSGVYGGSAWRYRQRQHTVESTAALDDNAQCDLDNTHEPSHTVAPFHLLGETPSFCKGPYSNICIPVAVLAAVPGKGGGLLEKPVIEKVAPDRESEFDLK
ncbi:hypothetical protein LR48_Vigan05g117800 [Vigna angularis]|uniref:Uncharacterized protein n=1 Tax=Phaseolus angularis TaxID=3914 RepID=A0A0L9ULF2_PHAAN|nr:hypothetical protein LR48_Vigan05g117800 [Vigna angularis]